MEHDFKAYDHRGKLVMHTWTSAYGSFTAEMDAYQQLLNRLKYAKVVVTSDDGERLTLWPDKDAP